VTHDPNCAVVRAGDLRAWCDCGEVRPAWYGGNKIPGSYLKKFLTSQGDEADPEMSYEMRLFLDEMGG
jgi:hypothetical protein